MATEGTVKATLQQRAMYEVKEFAILAVYLYITLGAVILMKTAVLHSQGIEFAFWGVPAIKAVVLAKFMLIGNALKIGERNSTRPLIWKAGRRGDRRSQYRGTPRARQALVALWVHL